MMKRVAVAWALPVAFTCVTACLSADPFTGADSGSVNSGTGGAQVTTSSGGNQGQTGSGGAATASGGGSGSGGKLGTGGGPSGGTTGSGGKTGTGGGPTGGVTGSGGGAGTGGRANTGGTGGGSATGGIGSGGKIGTGGAGTGGAATGGAGTGGAATGGAGTGGATSTSCTLSNHSGSGSFTYYYFGQGTGKEGSGYRTACGYYGTEGGSSKSGPNDTVLNVAKISPASPTYFAAIPGTNGFDTRDSCGACVQLTGQNGKVIIATIADECPYGSDGGNQPCQSNPGGHLDLSTAAFDQLGYSVGNPSGTTWKFVPCPVTGNVVLQIKNGNDNEFFIQNSILAIKSVTRSGTNAVHMKYGAWHFDSKLNSGDTLNLTDSSGRTLSVQVSSTTMGQVQDTGKQFPTCQ